ncbi:MAG: hypothetical protein ACTHMC_02850 [Pseudobacter sp.]|uniref:hypothetical protein n=1 Tax=Pseudobacter sp. TaxID=2045420 RepID=UPI003F81CE59
MDYDKQYGKDHADGYADCLRDLFLELESDVVRILPPGASDTIFKNPNATVKWLHDCQDNWQTKSFSRYHKVKNAAERERKIILRETPKQE